MTQFKHTSTESKEIYRKLFNHLVYVCFYKHFRYFNSYYVIKNSITRIVRSYFLQRLTT